MQYIKQIHSMEKTTGFENDFTQVIGIVACDQRRREPVKQSYILPFLIQNNHCHTDACQTRLQIAFTYCLVVPPAWSCSCLSQILFESFLLESWSCSRGESDPGLACRHSSGQILRPQLVWNLFWAASISKSATSDTADPLE